MGDVKSVVTLACAALSNSTNTSQPFHPAFGGNLHRMTGRFWRGPAPSPAHEFAGSVSSCQLASVRRLSGSSLRDTGTARHNTLGTHASQRLQAKACTLDGQKNDHGRLGAEMVQVQEICMLLKPSGRTLSFGAPWDR